MNPVARSPLFTPDKSFTPWLILALLLVGFVLQRMGAYVVLVSFDAGTPGLFLVELRRALLGSLTIFGLVPCFLLAPRWGWVPCAFFLVLSLVLAVTFSTYENLALFFFSTALPALTYGLATAVAVRRRRQLDTGAPRTSTPGTP